MKNKKFDLLISSDLFQIHLSFKEIFFRFSNETKSKLTKSTKKRENMQNHSMNQQLCHIIPIEYTVERGHCNHFNINIA